MKYEDYTDIYGVPSYDEFYNSYLYDKFLKSDLKVNGQKGSFEDYKKYFSSLVDPYKFENEVTEAYNNQFGFLNEKIADNVVSDLATQNAQQFAREQRDTQYQALTSDLEAAGINPIYAVNGASASVGNGVGAMQTNMENATTSREQMKIASATASSQIQLNKMQGIASIVGAIGSIIGAFGGAAHNFGLTSAKYLRSGTSNLVHTLSDYVDTTVNKNGEITGSRWRKYN